MTREHDEIRVHRQEAALLQEERGQKGEIAAALLNHAQAVDRLVNRHDLPVRMLHVQIGAHAMKPARQRDPRRPRRQVARAAPHDVGKIFRRKGRREEEILHRRHVVVDAEEDVRLALAQHFQRMFVVLGAHEAKAQSERLAERLQKARIDALGHALFQTVAEERLVSADVDDAQVGRGRQVGIFRRIEAHELVLRPIEKGLAQIRLEARIDSFRVKDRIAEVLQQTFPLLRRDELRGHEHHAQEQLLSILLTARTVQDGVDFATRKRLVQRLGGLMLDDVDAHALLAHERRQRIGIQAVI